MSRKHKEIRIVCKCYKEKQTHGCEDKWVCECCPSNDHKGKCKKTDEHHNKEKECNEKETKLKKEHSSDYDEWEEIVSHHSVEKKEHSSRCGNCEKKKEHSSRCNECEKKELPTCQCSDCKKKDNHPEKHEEWKKKTPSRKRSCKKMEEYRGKKNGYKNSHKKKYD